MIAASLYDVDHAPVAISRGSVVKIKQMGYTQEILNTRFNPSVKMFIKFGESCVKSLITGTFPTLEIFYVTYSMCPQVFKEQHQVPAVSFIFFNPQIFANLLRGGHF